MQDFVHQEYYSHSNLTQPFGALASLFKQAGLEISAAIFFSDLDLEWSL